MARKVFFSFHYAPDNWRAAQVRTMGVIEGDKPVSGNDWEKITKGGDVAIKKWIDDEMAGKTCAVILIGAGTAGRKWISHEISKAWNDGKGVFGINIHNLLDSSRAQSSKGGNPFDYVTFSDTGAKLSTVASIYDPPFTDSTKAYNYIKENMAAWVEAAIKQRAAK